MKEFHYYHESSGEFHSSSVVLNVPSEDLDITAIMNAPIGYKPIAGQFDPLCQRVDISLRNELIEFARDAHPINVQKARDAHELRVLDLRSKYESDMQAKALLNIAAIESAIAENRPRPRKFEPTQFLEPSFLEPIFDEAVEFKKATLAAIVDYQPPKPSEDHEWNPSTKRWVFTAAAQAKKLQRIEADAEIKMLSAKSERASREYLLGIQPTAEDIEKGAMTLEQIQSRMEELRQIRK